MNDIMKEVLAIINEIGYFVTLEEADKSLSNGLGVDSLQLVQIIIAIEDRFLFEFDDEDMAIGDQLTVAKLCNIVQKHLVDNSEDNA